MTEGDNVEGIECRQFTDKDVMVLTHVAWWRTAPLPA